MPAAHLQPFAPLRGNARVLARTCACDAIAAFRGRREHAKHCQACQLPERANPISPASGLLPMARVGGRSIPFVSNFTVGEMRCAWNLHFWPC
jgi:hypothetical protein